ncbi:hypothetical protein RO3G_10368 [Rhizopus delemar RA 99-880]|uniref:Uncharacterized protein n=1 Tax=Rhizopus delemar (strain RA 99-880 / ATCC MYA-4621 / FGSC 9543 / NRRL 43880) TaxID=246409 RepID=I1CB28_RHIO9|nr:hypothetical protein RO3G_10368 [Rhizopus delemar RA 99-880]|eukprot:EIE85658.1 hypothetical protein RO3G_10368 [Rhizopus delemar RA 99-880]
MITEARTAVLLRNANSYTNPNEATIWLLEHLFRPLTTINYDEYQVIFLSDSVKSLWDKKRKESRESHYSSPATTTVVSPATEGAPTPPVISNQTLPSNNHDVLANKMYLLTPRTRILTVTKEQYMVFMIDLSSSLATIETDAGKVMMGNAYQVLENVILGLVQPFSLSTSDTSPPIVMEHIIHITVIAECSQFGSNMNVIPILAEYPTMRVLLQNVQVTTSNAASVLKVLHEAINNFKMDLGNFRKKLTIKRSKLGYELDVRGDHSQTVEDGTNSNYNIPTMDSSAKRRSKSSATALDTKESLQQRKPEANNVNKKPDSPYNRHYHPNHHRHTSSGVSTQTLSSISTSNHIPITVNNTTSTTSANTSSSKRSPAKDHHRKDVWGVGKTGSNLSYILRAGLFALNLLPKQGKHSLVLITDGVVKSNISDETIIRQLTTGDISCSMIQIGQATGFFPGLNFGTTRLMVRKNKKGDNPDAEIDGEAFNAVMTDNTAASHQRVFPWDPLSAPISEDMGLLKYKEYFLPTECWHFMRARLRQGFTLHSVSLFDESNKSSLKSVSTNNIRTAANEPDSFQKKERVVIVFILRWQPHMTVEYRIKSLWTSSLRRYLKSISHNQERLIHIPEDPNSDSSDSIFSCMRAPKAEVLVRATTSFSHMLHNWDSFQRRNQMMAVQGAKTTMDLSSAPGFIKVGKMKRFLERLAESDSMLKQLTQFNQTEKVYSDPTDISAQQLNLLTKFSSLWAKLDRSDLRAFNMCWYDEVSVSLILNHAYSLSNSIQFYMDDNLEYDDAELALFQIYAKLEQWASFMSDDRQAYIKILTSPESHSVSTLDKHSINTKQSTLRFCELRVVRETDRLVCIRLLFFNISAHLRQLTIDSVLSMLNCKQDENVPIPLLEARNSAYDTLEQVSDVSLPNAITKRPLSSLLLRDAAHLVSKQNTEFDNKAAKSLWFISPAFLLTGEFIVRNFLQQNTWHWDLQDVHSGLEDHSKPLVPLINLAFEYIAINRSTQKWSILSFNNSFGHFYKEATTSNGSIFSIQYFIWKDNSKKTIMTETWVEPMSNEGTFRLQDSVKNEVFDKDKDIFTHLVTFDILYAFGHHIFSSIGDATKDRLETEDGFRESTRWMQRSSLFNISSVLRQGSLLLASYICPNYSRHYHPTDTGDQSAAAALAAVSNQPLMTQNTHLLEQDTNSILRTTRRNNNNLGNPRSRTVSRFSPLGSPLTNMVPPLVWHSDKNTTCTCPKPDELFCNEKDSISKLRPVLRDIALLHYYVEHSLSAVTDRGLSLSKSSSDDFWVNLIKDLIEMNEISVIQSTLFVAQNFRDFKYFIKVFDPSTFVLILVPRLDAIVKGMNHFDSKGGQDRQNHVFDRISLTIFECHRQLSGNSNSPLTKASVDQIKVRPVNSLSSKEWIESLGSTLRPSLLRGYLPNSLPDEPLSDRTLRLMQNITQVYSRSFVKSIFTCLLHGRAIDSEDFEKVLEICDESNLDIDLTGYLNVQTLLNKRSRTNEEELMSINQRFVSVLGHYFEPVIISNSEWTNIYCYRPPFAKVGQKLGLSLSSGEKPSNLADVVVCAQNPLFVRLECTFRQPLPNGVGYTEITFPLDSLPSLYQGQSDDGTPYNFEPRFIGTDYSPIDSADDTTATLHLVCMTLPQSDYDPPSALFSHLPQCLADNTTHHQASFLDVDKAHRARLPSLSQDKQDALVETEARLTWLFTEEIMHGLLRSGPVTQNVIRYIEAQLKKKNPFVDFPTTMFIPLAFVKNRRDSRRMFFEELEKHNNTPYRLLRVGDCFYASDNGHLSSQLDEAKDGESVFDGDGLNITANDEEESNDEYCQGLGISILEPETPEGEKEEETEAVVKQEPIHPQLYWLLLIPQAESVQIYFYSKMQQSVNRSEIIRVTKSMFACFSKYLFAPVDGEKQFYSSDEETSEDEDYAGATSDNLVEILSTSGEESSFSSPRKFLPGQFKCDIVFTKRFPLHWRLQPNAALNKLMTDTLLPFLVKNKSGMFVISHKNSVVYCFLSEVNIMIPDNNLEPFSFAAADDSMLYNPDSPYGSSFITNENNVLGTSHTRTRHPSHVYSKSSPQGSIASERQQSSPKNSPSLTDIGTSASSPVTGKKFNRQHEGRELVLEVYGVEADSYIIEGLVEMIESRITSEITLKEVQQFLIRNPTTKLSRADVDFILPIEREPLLQKQLCIPFLIKNLVQFLKILRKNILTSPSLHALYSNYLAGTMRRHHGLRYGSGYSSLGDSYHAKNEDTAKGGTFEEWSCLNLLFYYNYLNRAPGTYLPFEQRVGEGVAGICLTIVNEDDAALSKVVFDNTAPNVKKGRRLTLNTLKDCFNFDFEKSRNHYEGYKICIDIWSYSKLEVNHIYDFIFKCFKQSICDHMIETAISYIPPHVSTRKAKLEEEFKTIASLITYILEQAIQWESPSVKKCFRSISLTPWYFDGLAAQLKGDLQDIHVSLDPVIARARLTSDLTDIMNDKPKKISELNYKLHNPYEFYEKVFENSLLLEEDEEEEVENGQYVKGFTRLKQSSSFKSQKGTSSGKKGQHDGNIKRASSQADRIPRELPMYDHKNYKYLIISGLPELYSKYSLPSSRRFSMETMDMSQRSRGPMNSIEDELLQFTRKDLYLRREDTASIHSRQESLASSTSKPLPSFMSKHKTSEFRDMPHLHSFMVMTMDVAELTMYSYNYSDTFAEHIFNTMYKNVVQQETRHMSLNNILHQKIGLFYHTEKMSTILSHNNNMMNNLGAPPMLSSNSNSASNIGTPLQHSALTQIQINSNANSTRSPGLANTIVMLAQIDSSSSIPSIESMASSTEHRQSNTKSGNSVVVNFESLKQLMKNTYEFNVRYKFQQQQGAMEYVSGVTRSIFDTVDNARLSKTATSKSTNGSTVDVLYSAARTANANTVLRDTYARSTELNKIPYSSDYLVRHGEPYLHVYLSRSKPLEAHEKAFKVYTKWAERYYGPGHTKTIDEMMTVAELQEILKASRLLHFCRTPILFSDTITHCALGCALTDKHLKLEETTAWYERLARGFMKEYASYLESIGMHLIVYGPSNNQQDELEAYLSQFTIAESYSVDSPVVYLLQVFEGGSIMCEARLTGAFVSVTLYTLHRRYGRLQYSPYSHQSKEVGRENFQKFMAECDDFKQRIHVNSFVFDFHLRYIQRSLDDVELLPSNLDLLSIIRKIASVYNRPAIYARNRIIQDSYEMPVDGALEGLVPWMLSSGSKLGLKTLKRKDQPVACFVSADDLSFDLGPQSDSIEDTPFRYTLLICPAETHGNDMDNRKWNDSVSIHQQGSFDMTGPSLIEKVSGQIPQSNECSLSLQCFILITYRGMDRCTSSERCQRAWSEVLKVKPKRYNNLFDEVLEPETITVKDVFDAAKIKLSNIANKAIYFYHRENDWNKLYEITLPHPSNDTSPHEMMNLAARFGPIDLCDADPIFSKLLKLRGLNWNNLMDYLKPFYAGASGEIHTADVRQLLLFVPHVPVFFNLEYKVDGSFSITINNREDRQASGMLDEEEKTVINQLATIISYYIWKHIK